jgi:hypothetical protein
MTKEKFFKAYANLPEDERNQTIIIIDGKPHTWNKAYDEIKAGTKLGDRILEKMEKLKLI